MSVTSAGGRTASRLFLLLALALCFGCSHLMDCKRDDKGIPQSGASLHTDLTYPERRQLVVVTGEGGSSDRARLSAWERDGGCWRLRLGPVPAAVGRNGLAQPGAKREGDGKTPSGLFPLEFVFGYAATAPGKMPYRQATADDLWVDDVNSPDYNTWVRRGETSAASFEVMKLPDHRYRHGIVIGYNRNPIVKGKGSAIFVHAWLAPGRNTAGCVALDEDELVRLIGWLDPRKSPAIAIGDATEIEVLTAGELEHATCNDAKRGKE